MLIFNLYEIHDFAFFEELFFTILFQGFKLVL